MSILKCALTGDMHVNVPKRSDEAYRIAYWMGEDWRARGVHLIGIGGDLVDGPLSERERAKLIDLIVFYSKIAPVVVNDGNHEVEFALRNALGKIPNVIVEDGAYVHRVETAAGPIAVACVSFPKKAALLAAVGRPVSGEEAEQVAGQALQDVFRGLGAQLQNDGQFDGLPCVALVHGTIRGSKVQADDQPDRPLGLDIGLPDITLIGADFYNVPHIHLAQEWEYNGVTVATPSSPFFNDYGEAKHFKGYILAEFHALKGIGLLINEDKLTPIDLSKGKMVVKWSRVPTPATPMILFADTWGANGDGGWSFESPWPDAVKGADIRFRFNFPSDQRQAAVNAAEEVAAGLREQGAVNVTLDPVLIPTTRSRIPALATTVRLEDKLRLYWRSIDFQPSAEREADLTACLHEIQEEAAAQGLTLGSAGRTAPALRKAKLKGFLKYPNEVDLDFTQMEGPLTAIVAPNEMGKTVLMQLLSAGLLYGTTPSRGSIDELAIESGAFIEGEFTMGGAEYKLTQVAATKSRTGRTSYAGTVSLLKNGIPELGNKSAGGRDEYDLWGKKNLLPKSIYDAVICQSGTESVIDMKDGARTELLLRVLGLEVYEVLAEKARKRATAVTEELGNVRTRIEEIGVVDLSARMEAVSQLEHSQGYCRGQLELLNQDLLLARTKASEVEKQRAEYDALIVRRDDLAAQVTAKRESRTQIDTRLQVNRELTDQKAVIEKAAVDVGLLEVEIAGKPTRDLELQLSEAVGEDVRLRGERKALIRRADELIAQEQVLSQRLVDNDTATIAARAVVADAGVIRKAVTESREYTVKWEAKRTEINAQRIRETELKGKLAEVRARFNGNAQRAAELIRKRNEASISIAGKAGVLDAVAGVANRTKDIETVTAEIGRYQIEIEHLQSSMTSAASAENTSLRTGHIDIIAGADPIPRAERAIEDADQVMEEASESPARLAEAKKQLAGCEEALKQYQRSLAAAQAEAARLPHIEAMEKVLAETLITLETVNSLHQSLTEESNGIIAQRDELVTAREQSESDLRWLQEQITGLEPLVGRAELLATANTKIQGLEEQAITIKADRETVGATLDSIQQASLVSNLAIDDAKLRTESLRSKIAANQAALDDLSARIKALKPIADKATLLAIAESAADQLLHQLSGIDKELEALEHRHDQVENQVDSSKPPEPVDLTSLEAAVSDARAALTDVQTRLAVAQRELSEAEAKEKRRQQLSGEIRGFEERVSNWTLLGLHLGKTGLQSEEISCAGPQLTEITNDLLRSAGDTRHTVSIETERLHSNKKDLIPCLDINVFDSEEQISKESRRLSDGGKVMVGEPFSLALVILGCLRAGITGLTIFRDESTGCLDVINSGKYIAELRRFAEILQAHVLFISQDPQMWELADSRIKIDSGRISIS